MTTLTKSGHSCASPPARGGRFFFHDFTSGKTSLCSHELIILLNLKKRRLFVFVSGFSCNKFWVSCFFSWWNLQPVWHSCVSLIIWTTKNWEKFSFCRERAPAFRVVSTLDTHEETHCSTLPVSRLIFTYSSVEIVLVRPQPFS